jgi:hypothetical protein
MKNRTSIFALALLAVLFTSCSKHSPDAAAVRPKVSDLGVVEVSDGVTSRHDLGNGRVCVIKPTIKTDGTVLLAMTIEETDSNGADRVLSHLNALTFPDRSVEVSDNGVGVGLTPHIKQ